MTGFTFKYPVFEEWEVKEVNSNAPDKCKILLNWPQGIQFDYRPTIFVNKQARDPKIDFEIPSEAASNKNLNGIQYIYTKDAARGNFVTFYISGFKVFIELGNHSEEHGFSKLQFFKTVIESFRVMD